MATSKSAKSQHKQATSFEMEASVFRTSAPYPTKQDSDQSRSFDGEPFVQEGKNVSNLNSYGCLANLPSWIKHCRLYAVIW